MSGSENISEPEDIKSLLDGIIKITLDIRELQAFYTQFQVTPTKASKKAFMIKRAS
jgi:hypothetical protein